MSELDNELGSKSVPDERGEQAQSDMPDIKGKDDLDEDAEDIPQAAGVPTLPADHESNQD
jgi:hypothetical protein